MKLIAIMPARNESWCLGLSARAALMWCDELLVLDHASTDDTAGICGDLRHQYRDRFHYLHDPDPTWREMAHRQYLLNAARQRGTTHIAMIDADEVLSAAALPHIRKWIEVMPGGEVLTLPWLCLRDDIDTVMMTGLWGNATVSVAFVDDPVWHWAPQGPHAYDFHHRHPMGRHYVGYWPRYPGFSDDSRSVGLMHLQFVSMRRLFAKQALYQATEVLRWPGRKPVDAVREMYAKTVREAMSARIEAKPHDWLWGPHEQLLRYLNVDAEPWQEAELRRLVAEHGRDKFKGLDFFGVA